jgi:GGDEF domain-containing protein
VILLPHTDAPEARCAADRLRMVVESHSFPRRKRLTVSMGIATFPADAADSTALLVRADQARHVPSKPEPKPAPVFDPEQSVIN